MFDTYESANVWFGIYIFYGKLKIARTNIFYSNPDIPLYLYKYEIY